VVVPAPRRAVPEIERLTSGTARPRAPPLA
jgi:hypothetical protein